jgi:hypothetical protein
MGLGVKVGVAVGGGEVKVGVKVISVEEEQATIKERSGRNVRKKLAIFLRRSFTKFRAEDGALSNLFIYFSDMEIA